MTLWRRIFAERRSLLVPLLALLVIDGILIGAVVVPLQRTVAAREDDAAAARTQLALANQSVKMWQAARASRERAEKELDTFYTSVLPTGQPAASRALQLEVARLARENSLRLGARSYDDEEVKDSSLRRLISKVELTGDYGNVLRFIYDLETSETFLVINSISLAQAAQTNASGQLQLSIEMATYYRVAP
jgi:Tfp pilus assembly protein PilO